MAQNLDQLIRQDLEQYHMDRFNSDMPPPAAIKVAEMRLHTGDLKFTPDSTAPSGTRWWKITMPAETGRKMRKGMRLILMFNGDYYTVNVYVCRWRRIVSPRFQLVRGAVPVFGTAVWVMREPLTGLHHVTDELWLLDRFTRPG